MQAPNAGSETQSLNVVQLAARLGASLALLLLLSLALSHWLKPQLQSLAKQFYERFGAWGAAFGTWLADGFNFPIPPQAYMLLAEAHGAARQVLPAIVLGSLAGGVSGYAAAPVLMRLGWVRSFVERTRDKVQGLFERRWLVASLVLSVSPIAFSWLCYSAALYRVPRRTFAVLCLLRVPKLVVYQQLISWGWS